MNQFCHHGQNNLQPKIIQIALDRRGSYVREMYQWKLPGCYKSIPGWYGQNRFIQLQQKHSKVWTKNKFLVISYRSQGALFGQICTQLCDWVISKVVLQWHYMGVVAFHITVKSTDHSKGYPKAKNKKNKYPCYCPFLRETTGDRWIPRIKGHLCGCDSLSCPHHGLWMNQRYTIGYWVMPIIHAH